MQDGRVARRYATALFESAKAAGTIAPVESDLETIVKQLDSDPEFHRFMLSPYASREEKIKILDVIFQSSFSPLSRQLIRIVLEKGRENEIVGIHQSFTDLRRTYESVAHALITSAEPLDDVQKKQVVTKLGTVLNRTIEPEFEVDASLIGGIRVKYENFILDGSVQGALSRLKEKLTHDVLKQA